MKAVADTLENRKKSEIKATLSACFGAMGDITLTDSAIIILFAQIIGAGDMMAMLSTSLIPLFNGFCIIPMAFVAAKIGYKKLILAVAFFNTIAYFMVIASPFMGRFSVGVFISMMMILAFFQTGYVAAWFPFIDSFLLKERRSLFLGKMRFSWQLSSGLFLLMAGFFVGKNPTRGDLQLVLLTAALLFTGRMFWISRIPPMTVNHPTVSKISLLEGIRIALRNKPLVGYSAYLFVLNLAAYGTLPLTTLFLKNQLHAPDNIIVMISAVTLFGMLSGSLCSIKLIGRWGIKNTFLLVHICYAAVNFSLFFIGSGNLFTYIVITLLLLIYSFNFALANVSTTTEMMALSTPGNKAMAMAFCGTFYYSGSGLSRLLSSLVLGSGMLASEWFIGSMKISMYQSFYLIYTVAIVFAAMFLVVVPAVFPKGKYIYAIH